MPELGLETMDDAALYALIDEIRVLLEQRQAEREAALVEADVAVLDSISKIEALLGPEEGPAGLDSIRAVRRYSQADMHENAGLGLELAFLALEMMGETVRDIAVVLSRK